MSFACDNCGKKSVVGSSQRHGRGVAGKRWAKRSQETKRLFRPNLQKIVVMQGSKSAQAKLCTSCIKRIKKFGSIGSYHQITTI